MKKYIYLTILFFKFSFLLYGQLNPRDSIIQIIESLKSVGDFMSYQNRSELNNKWEIAAGLMRNLYHTKDSALIHYLDSNFNFINTHKNPNILIVTHGTNGSSSFISAYRWYLRYHNYIDLDSISLFKAYARDELISDLTNQMDMDQIRHYLPYLDPLEIYNLIKILRGQTDLSKPVNTITIWSEFRNTIILDSTLHQKLLMSLSKTNPPGPGDSVLQLEVLRFNSLNPRPWNISETLDYIQKTKNQSFHQFITSPTVDSAEIERKKIIQENESMVDSLIHMGYEGGAAPEVIDILHQFRSDENKLFAANANIKVVIFDSLSAEEKREYLVAADTTLWEPENRIYMYRGSITDDGMRFDTFSNAELVTFLDTFSYWDSYPPDTPYMRGYSHNTTQVHLHKVCQILGDRRAYGAFVPDSTQQYVVARFIDTLLEFGRLDTPKLISNNKKSEAQHLMIRLGRLGFPTFIGLLTDPPFLSWERICDPQEIFRQITEEEIIQLVAKADAYLAQGDTLRARDIATYMYRYLSKEIYVEPIFRRPRRPIAPTRERQRWHDEYIWPLLLRMDHWYTRMK